MSKKAGPLRGPGRPPAENGLKVQRDDNGDIVRVQVAQGSNYAALANQVADRLERAQARKVKLTMRAAVRAEIIDAIRRNNETPPALRPTSWSATREGKADELAKTAYIEVRKLLARLKRERKDNGR
jgi:hypothetical protein